MIPQDLVLKVTPPRVQRHVVARGRLLSAADALRDAAALMVRAPAGTGKTSLLAQWRLEQLALGVPVAWVGAQAIDDPARLEQSLALALRIAMARPAFGRTVLEDDRPGTLAGMTALLAELAQSAASVVLIVDEVDRLPVASRSALSYLLRNVPVNVRVFMAARPDGQLDIDDLIAYGQCVEIGAAQLRFSLEETLQLLQARFGARVGRDAAAQLHALTEGWPLGLQLAMSILSRDTDAGNAIAGLGVAGGALQGELVGLLLADMDSADRDFLVRVSVLDLLHPALCRAVAGADDAAARLTRLASDTPVFAATEGGDWLRMHALVRDALRRRFADLDEAEQIRVHAGAAQWLAAHDLPDEAARHALSAGQHQQAYALAERSLYESLMRHGRLGAVLEWLARLPAEELDQRPRLLLAVAWTLASSERHEEAARLVARILAQPEASDALRCECALILGGAAAFADDPDRFVALHAPWTGALPLTDPLLLQSHANRMAYCALLEGEPALARLREQRAVRGRAGHAGQGTDYVRRWSELVIGLSYVTEGQVLLAEPCLRSAVASAEAQLGRRHRFSCNLAALLAATAWERDLPGDASALLADRLDVLENSGLPESLMLAYLTASRIAVAEGVEHRALELLAALDAAGAARRLPRLRIASLAEQVRVHARRHRAQTCRELCDRIDRHLADPAAPQGPLWRRSAEMLRDVARGYDAIAAREWQGALAPLERADERARALRRGGLHIELLALRALALERCGRPSAPLVREAVDLARALGLQRVFADAHPELGAWVDALAAGDGRTVAAAPPAPSVTPAPPLAASAVLTPKEREVLALLARNLSNKEIARAMQAGETTIKWHVKNLFAKLDAGSRAQVVQRARILGLLGGQH